MNIITDTWRQLLRRRLLPVAVLLLGALVAVPLLLAKHPSAPAGGPATGAAPAAGDDGIAKPVVALATDDGSAPRRRVLGAPKDPFKPAPLPKAKQATAGGVVTGSSPSGGSSAPSSSPATGGGSAPSISVPVSSPLSPGVSAPTGGSTPKKKSYPLYSLSVRFGDSSSDKLEASTVERLAALPSADNPVLVYLGVEDNGKTAVFLLDSGVTAKGDGTCDPDPANCETVRLHEGDTEFFDVPADTSSSGSDSSTSSQGGQYELDLVKIHRKSTASSAKARRARATASAAGRRILRSRVLAKPLRYSYDARTGTLHRLSRRAYRAAVARASARAHS